MNNLDVKIKRVCENAIIPAIQTPGSAGADLYACLDKDTIIPPGETVMVPLGFKTEFPEDYVALIYARSGLATRDGIAPANKVCVIDSDYRGEWKIPLHNHYTVPYMVSNGDRIAQVLFHTIFHPNFIEVDDLSTTERGEGGFNSTGKN